MKHLNILAAVLSLTATPAAAQTPEIADALDGVDTVVLLQQNREVFGKSGLSIVRDRFRYLFSSAETKAIFEREPEKYEIALGGLCARMGKTTSGNPSDYLVHNGKIYIFGSDECHKRFAAAPGKYLAPPPAPVPTSAAATTKGRDLIDRAVAWMGGAARVDAVSTLVESATQVQKRAQGEVKVSMKTMWRFPGEVRSERTMERSDGPAMSFATVLTPEDMFSAGMGRVFPIVRPGRQSLEMDFGRHPLAILRARRQRDFTGAALGPAMVEGTPVEQVRVVNGAVDAVLGIEPKSGQLHTVTFTDRNLAGEVGTCTVIYSDFREVAGIRLPHQTRSLFNGEPDAFQTWTVQSIQINHPLDPALFTRPTVQSR